MSFSKHAEEQMQYTGDSDRDLCQQWLDEL